MSRQKVSDRLAKELAEWGSMKQTGVNLKQMINSPSEISAQFLHKELSIRIAHRVDELQNLPYDLSSKKAVLQVRDWYVDSFRDLRSYPEIKDKKDELKFTQLVKMIKVRHNNVVPMMTLGVKQFMKERPQFEYKDLKQIHQFLDPFYTSRIGIRMLIGNHVASNCVGGYIHKNMSPLEVVRAASEDVRGMCLRQYGSAPKVWIYSEDPDFTFPYVPSHLHMMVFELVNNSARAIRERFMDYATPPITISIMRGLKDVTIKISDRGSGIPISGLYKIFTYLYCTEKQHLMDEYFTSSEVDAPCTTGYGSGIPISSLYARYFGGNLHILPTSGNDAHVFLRLMPLGDSQEV